MTVPVSTYKSGPYLGNGVATSFAFDFKVFAKEDIRVILTNIAAALDTDLVLDSDYSVALNPDQDADPGGTITYPLAGSPMTSANKLTIASALEVEQPLDITNLGGFFPQTQEDAFDRGVILTGQLALQVDGAIRLPLSAENDIDTELPLPVANNVLAWTADGKGLQNVDPATLASVAAFSTAMADTFIGDGATVNFTLSANPAAQANLDVSIAGVVQVPGIDYTWSSGTTLAFTTAPGAGERVLARYMQGLPVANDVTAAMVQGQTLTTLTTIAGTNTITGTAASPFTGYAVKQRFTFVPVAINTGAATLNINGSGAGAIQSGGVALKGGELQTGVPVEVYCTATTPVFEIVGGKPAYLAFGGTEAVRVNASGQVMLGTDAVSLVSAFSDSALLIGSDSSIQPNWRLARFNNGTAGANIRLTKGRGTAAAATIVQNNDSLGMFQFQGAVSASAFGTFATIQAFVDSVPGVVNDYPGRLSFQVVPDASGTLTEALLITRDQQIIMGSGGAAALGYTNAGDVTLPSSGVIRAKNTPKVWVVFDATSGTPTITQSFNVTSLTDNGAGDTTINFTIGLAAAAYCATGMAGNADGNVYIMGGPNDAAPSASAVRVNCTNSTTGVNTDTAYQSVCILSA